MEDRSCLIVSQNMVCRSHSRKEEAVVRKMPHVKLESCPNCHYTLLERSTNCPYCGIQLTYSPWKKLAAWLLLILIGYGLVDCHVRMLDGLQGF